MKYQVGRVGRIIVARFEDGDKILEGLAELAREEDIRAGVVYLVGGVKRGRIVVGPENDDLPPTPARRELIESHEAACIGTVFWYGDEPRIHLHGMYGKHDGVRMGCLRETADAFVVMEAVIVEIDGVNAVRDFDQASEMVLLKLID